MLRHSEPDLPVQACSIRIIQISDSSSSDNTFLDIMIADEFLTTVPSTVNTREFMSRRSLSPYGEILNTPDPNRCRYCGVQQDY
jgi:hypothetical protein